MATPLNNWVSNNEKVSEAALKAVEKLRKIEKKRRKEGWKWIRLSPRTKVFVPCDKRGNPTEVGQKIIENAKKTCF
jgi:hypothetical protein